MDGRLTKNFQLAEFSCRCGCGEEERFYQGIKTLAETVQQLRDVLNADTHLDLIKKRALYREFRLQVLSGFRCERHNAAEGGAEKSQHLEAKAADIACSGLPTELLYEAARSYFNGCIWYKGRYFVHCDLRDGAPVQFIKEPS